MVYGLWLLPSTVLAGEATLRPMQMWVTVDWEGVSLEEENLQAMRRFRHSFPQMPMLHLINPAYFVQPGVDAAQVAAAIRSTFLPIDTTGLHLHPMRTLVQYCGLTYQAKPSIADLNEDCEAAQCGYTVSLELSYNKAELTQLVSCSSQLLSAQGFARPSHFRAGAWQFGPKLQAALEANQFRWDSSRIDAQLLTTRWHPDSPLLRFLRQLHYGSSPLDQPYALSAQLTEYPNNAALADYTTPTQLLGLFKQLLAADKTVMVLGFHQETAADYLEHLALALPKMEALAKQHQRSLQWQPSPP